MVVIIDCTHILQMDGSIQRCPVFPLQSLLCEFSIWSYSYTMWTGSNTCQWWCQMVSWRTFPVLTSI